MSIIDADVHVTVDQLARNLSNDQLISVSGYSNAGTNTHPNRRNFDKIS